jgi:hypothetical protein
MTVFELAARQLRDYLEGTPGTYLAEDHPPLELEEAYRVQAEVAQLRLVAGDSIAGYKIGWIGPKIREALGMSGPVRGVPFTSELRPPHGQSSPSPNMVTLPSKARWRCGLERTVKLSLRYP